MTFATMFVTNLFIRFLPTKKQYFSLDSKSNLTEAGVYTEMLLEGTITGAIIIFSNHYFKDIYGGLFCGGVYLTVGLSAIYQRSLQSGEVEQKSTNSKIVSYIVACINTIARFHKSVILLSAAIYKLQNMFADYGGINLNLKFLDIMCLTVIFGGPIGVNKSALDRSKLSKHVSYLKAKLEMGLFGKIGCLFYSSNHYPPREKQVLTEILRMS